ncbi:hypothetical protein PPROV_000132400 [Pycnococcus provasolii]|uniref:Uncharacterized protein n=2 Tax=Pycnococcus provasolii TaxID=41880 RepID=A0A830H7C7_9CHLO|nr:hypothetical protein PPROV_000132400 [Pycnococcus provasolii]
MAPPPGAAAGRARGVGAAANVSQPPPPLPWAALPWSLPPEEDELAVVNSPSSPSSTPQHPASSLGSVPTLLSLATAASVQVIASPFPPPVDVENLLAKLPDDVLVNVFQATLSASKLTERSLEKFERAGGAQTLRLIKQLKLRTHGVPGVPMMRDEFLGDKPRWM